MLRILGRVPLATLLFLTACGAAPITPVTVSLTDGGLQVPPEHRPAVEEIVGVMRDDLGLPVPQRVSVYVYESRASFREGLMDEGYVAIDRVNEIASFAAGLAPPRRALPPPQATRGPPGGEPLPPPPLPPPPPFNPAGARASARPCGRPIQRFETEVLASLRGRGA